MASQRRSMAAAGPAALLIAIVQLLASAFATPPVALAAGGGLELALEAPATIDATTPFDLTVTVANHGSADCRVSTSPAALFVRSVSVDGTAVTPILLGPGVDLGLRPPAASLTTVPAGGTVTIPVPHEAGSIDAVSVLPDDPATAIVRQFSLGAAGTYAISVGLAPLAVIGCDAPSPASVAFRVAPASTGLPVLAIGAFALIALAGGACAALLLRRRRRPAQALVVILATVAGISLSPRPAAAQVIYHFGPVATAAADGCVKLFDAPATSAGPGGDPAGVWAQAQSTSHAIYLDSELAMLATLPASKGKGPVPAGVATDSTVFWQAGLYSGNGVAPDDCANLYHLLAIAVDFANGTVDTRRRCPGGLGWEDVRATLAENQYRASYGLPLVTSINGQPLPASLDDCKAPQKPKRKGPLKITCQTASCAYVGGDPHYQTFDGLRYDLQSAGEFVLVRAANEPLEIQVRQQAVPGSTSVSAATAVAARIGPSRVTIAVALEPSTGDVGGAADVRLGVRIDGSPVPDAGSHAIGGAGAVEISTAGDQVALEWADGSAALASIVTGSPVIRVDVRPSPALRGEVAGLLGDDDGTQANDLALADGTVLRAPASFADLHGRFADAWRVTDATSLFDYRAGESTATFTDRAFPTEDATAAASNGLDGARAMCEALGVDVTDEADLADCALDLASTGQASFAAAAIEQSLAPADDATEVGSGASGGPSPMPGASGGVVDGGPMGPGDTVTGTLADPAERVVYELHAEAGTVGVFIAGGDCSPLSGGGAPTWYVARASAPGTPITGTLPFCVDLGRYTFPAAGDYVLVLDAGGYTVPYSFTWTAVASSSNAPIGLDTDVHGTLTTAGQRDTYLFATTEVALDIELVSPNGCDDGFVWKVTQGLSTTGLGTLCGTSPVVHLGGGGIWQIVISSPDATGEYSFRMQRVGP